MYNYGNIISAESLKQISSAVFLMILCLTLVILLYVLFAKNWISGQGDEVRFLANFNVVFLRSNYRMYEMCMYFHHLLCACE